MLKSLLSLFLQPNCPLCERPADDAVCKYCQRALQGSKLSNPCQFWQGDIPLFVWGLYGGGIKRAIAALKYDNNPQVGEMLGSWLGRAWLDSPPAKIKKAIVVPIPLHAHKLKERGFNQAETIAASFCRQTGYTLEKQGLKRVRKTEAMFGLTAKQRTENMRGAFLLGKGFRQPRPKYPVLLLDDIYTTGTTIREAAKVLRNAGIKVCGVGAIATPQKSDRSK